jgi:hypothetical protein
VGDFTVFQDEFRRLAEQYQIAVYHELIRPLGLLSIAAIAWASLKGFLVEIEPFPRAFAGNTDAMFDATCPVSRCGKSQAINTRILCRLSETD